LVSYKAIEVPDAEMPEKQVIPTRTTEKPAVGSTLEVKTTEVGLLGGLKHFIGKIFKTTEVNESATKNEANPINIAPPLSSTTARRPQQFKGKPSSRGNFPKKRRDYHGEHTQQRRRPNRYSPGSTPNSRGTTKKTFGPPPSNIYPEITAERIEEESLFSPTKEIPENFPTDKFVTSDNLVKQTEKVESSPQTQSASDTETKTSKSTVSTEQKKDSDLE
jgi:hypothetical protein